jgi:hypothetical protein
VGRAGEETTEFEGRDHIKRASALDVSAYRERERVGQRERGGGGEGNENTIIHKE